MGAKDRIHRYLDGELPYEALSAEDRDEAKRYEVAVGAVIGMARAGAPPDLAAAVMQRIEALDPAGREPQPRRVGAWLARLAAWLWHPRQVTVGVRPAFAGAVALAVLAVGTFLTGVVEPVEMVNEAPQVFVQFRLDVADVQRVALAGDFTEWQPLYELHQTGPGVWSVTVALDPGVHDYAFVIDGERWVADPLAARIDDGFGGVNSRVAVLVPDRRRSS